MSRRYLDIILATGGVLFAGLIVVLALVVRNEGNFARDTVRTQLSEQKIVFKEVDKLTESERGLEGAVKYAGQPVASGKQAEAYASIIALHLDEQATKAGFEGETYASISTPMAALRTKIADAKAAGDTEGAAAAQKQLDAATALRESQFKGETLRGVLLTSYGFSVLGDRAMLAANVLFGIGALAAVIGFAGYVHALATPKDKKVFGGVFAPNPTNA